MPALLGSLQQRCESLLSGLDVPDPFDVDVLLSRVAARRQRPVRLLPLLPGLRDDPSGMWVPLPEEDVLFAESGISDWYRDHVILHEVGHMLWEHAGTVQDVTQWLSQYGVRPQRDTHVQLRCSVTAVDREREAEMVALIIESRITRRVLSARPTSPPAEIAAVLDRLASALGSVSPHDEPDRRG